MVLSCNLISLRSVSLSRRKTPEKRFEGRLFSYCGTIVRSPLLTMVGPQSGDQ